MKSLQRILPIVAAVALAGVAHGENLQQALTDAQLAYNRGDFPEAKSKFEFVLRADPKNTTAIGYLKMIKVREEKDGGVAAIEKNLEKLIIPEIKFKEATIGSALEFLKKKVSEVSGGKQSVNFVIQPNVDQNTAITLNLTQIPFTEALRYVGDLANLSFVYQKHAIVVKPKSAVASTPVQQPATGQ